MLEYISAPEAAKKWGISERWVQKSCEGNRIPGVVLHLPKLTGVYRLPKQIKPCTARDFKASAPLLNAMTELSKRSTAIIHSALLSHYLLKQ